MKKREKEKRKIRDKTFRDLGWGSIESECWTLSLSLSLLLNIFLRFERESGEKKSGGQLHDFSLLFSSKTAPLSLPLSHCFFIITHLSFSLHLTHLSFSSILFPFNFFIPNYREVHQRWRRRKKNEWCWRSCFCSMVLYLFTKIASSSSLLSSFFFSFISSLFILLLSFVSQPPSFRH